MWTDTCALNRVQNNNRHTNTQNQQNQQAHTNTHTNTHKHTPPHTTTHHQHTTQHNHTRPTQHNTTQHKHHTTPHHTTQHNTTQQQQQQAVCQQECPFFLWVTSANSFKLLTMDVDSATGAARRRQRRLRQFLRHERLRVAMAPCRVYAPYSSTETDDGKGQGGGERDVQRHGPDDSSPRAACAEYYRLDDDGDALAARPTPLVAGGTAAHRGAHRGHRAVRADPRCACVAVGEEQVIAVPKISQDRVPQRSVVVHGELNSWWKCRRSSLKDWGRSL